MNHETDESVRQLGLIAQAQETAEATPSTRWLDEQTLAALDAVAQVVEDVELADALDQVKAGGAVAAHERLRAAAALRWLMAAIKQQHFCLELADAYLTGKGGRGHTPN